MIIVGADNGFSVGNKPISYVEKEQKKKNSDNYRTLARVIEKYKDFCIPNYTEDTLDLQYYRKMKEAPLVLS